MNRRHNIYEKLSKVLQDRRESVIESLCHGIVTDFTAVQVLRSKLEELAFMEQEIKTLQKRLDYDD